MQVLLEKEKEDFKQRTQAFIDTRLNKSKELNLKALWQNLYKEGLINKENGVLQNILLSEILCKFRPGIGLFLITQFTCIEIIKNFASDSLKEKYLNKLFSGENISCFSITEPNAGSDVSMIEAFAEKKGNSWLLNGHKIWASNGSISDIIITFVQTKSHKDKSGITCLIIPSKCKEVEILKDTPKLGVEITPSNEVFIKNLTIDENSQIGNLGDGIKIALSTITLGRIFCAAQAVGLLSGVLEESIKHSTKGISLGNQFQIIRQ